MSERIEHIEDMAEKKSQEGKSEHRGGRGGKRDRENRGRNPRQGGRGRGERDGNMPPRRDRQPSREQMAPHTGPPIDLQPKEGGQKKFTGRCRLFIGNLPSSLTEEDFRNLFTPFGEISEVFLNAARGFGFVKLDTKQNAEAAKAALDLTVKDGKALRVRFATHGAALKVKNLNDWVSNELLEAAFCMFGEVERAVVIVDDRGRPVGEGIIEYSRKQAAQTALKRCSDGCFLLTASPRPVTVEPLEQRDEEDGLPEKNFQKNNKQYLKEREIGPRFAELGTFEYEYALRWKQLYEVEKQKRKILENEIVEARYALEEQMEYSLYEHETNLLREKLCRMEEQSSLLQREREMRLEENRRRDEQRRQEEMMIRQQQEEILRRRGGSDDSFRWQEDRLMMQANSLSGMLDRQEAALRQLQGSGPQNMNEHMGVSSPNVADNSSGNAGTTGGQGMGMPPQRQFQFDQPPPFMPGPPNKTGIEQRDHREDFSGDAKRRRY